MEVSQLWSLTAGRSTPRTPSWKRTGPGEHSPLSHGCNPGFDQNMTDFISLCMSRSPPRPSPGGLHYSDEDICNNYNGAVLTESTTLTEKPTEVSESEVCLSTCLPLLLLVTQFKQSVPLAHVLHICLLFVNRFDALIFPYHDFILYKRFHRLHRALLKTTFILTASIKTKCIINLTWITVSVSTSVKPGVCSLLV